MLNGSLVMLVILKKFHLLSQLQTTDNDFAISGTATQDPRSHKKHNIIQLV